MNARPWLVGCLLLGATLAVPAAPFDAASAAAIAQAMQSARDSDGFEMRLALTTRAATGHAPTMLKVALIGQADATRQRLLVRGIAPARIRDRGVVVERVQAGVRSRAVAGAAGTPSTPVDPQRRLFDSGLVAWDLMTPWWNWPEQHLGPVREMDGHRCVEVRSVAPAGDATGVHEVISCVEPRAGLAWRTRLFDRHHRELRRIDVTRALRTQAGTSIAKSATIVQADGATTQVELYSGDERHTIAAGRFSGLDAPGSAAR